MEIFFGRTYAEQPFEIFSRHHLLILVSILMVNLILVVWFKSLKRKKGSLAFRYGLAFLLIGLEVLFTGWSIYVGDWSLDYALPLHLCDAAILVAAAMLISRNRIVFEVAYFWVLGGCTQALLTPDVGFNFPHFMFLYFFIGHGAVITAVLYMIHAEGFRPYLHSIPKAYVLTNIYMVFVSIINLLTGGNYLFLCQKPGNSSVMDFMGPWPWYILVLELATLIIFSVCYLPYLICDSLRGRTSRPHINRQQKGINL